MNDLRLAFRQLLKNPGFSAVAAITLALGIGANTAIFSVMDALLLKLLPVRNPEQLVVLNHAGGDRRGNGFSYPVYEHLRDRNSSLSDIFAFSTWPELIARIDAREEPMPGGALLVSGNYFAALGIQPFLGRLITPDDNRVLSGHPVAVLSYGFWQRRFGGDRTVIGRSIALNGTPFTIIGITPPEFFGVRVGRADAITIPIMMQPQMMPGAAMLRNPKNWDVEIMGRLQHGDTGRQATANLSVLFPQIELEMEGGNPSAERRKMIADRKIILAPASQGLSELRRQFSEPLRILMAVVSLVLLIACANVANLLLARSVARRREIAVRLALGAGRFRLVRQLLTESVLLAFVGGAAGLLLAKWISRLCVSLIPDRVGTIDLNLAIDSRVLIFTTTASLLTGILFGILPAWQATQVSLGPALKDGAREFGHGFKRFWLSKGLVAAQVAVSLTLLAGAGLFVRTFQNLKTLNPGFAYENLLLFSLDSRMRGGTTAESVNLFKDLLERVSHVPGVLSVTVSRDGAFGEGGRTRTDLTVDNPGNAASSARDVFDVAAGPRFFETMGVPLIEGRAFTLEDDDRSAKVAIINETAARHFFGQENPVGRQIGVGAPGDTTIIGVAKDAKLNTLREETPRVMYRPFLQTGPPRRMTFAIRTAAPPVSLLRSLREELAKYDPNLPLFGFTTLQNRVEKSLAQEKLFAALSSLFGVLALLLAAAGLYGVMAYSVSQRTREIGIRMALGARTKSVLALVLAQGMKVVFAGLAVGLIAAAALSRIVANRLFGVTPADPLVLTSVSGLLLAVAFLACYLPARRATHVNPIEALRSE